MDHPDLFPVGQFGLRSDDMGRRRNPYVNDANTRRARSLGFPARSVFKLQEMDRRFLILHARQRVLDLGAAPGSWAKYAAQRVGPEGAVVAVDRVGLSETLPQTVEVLVQDAGMVDLGPWSPFDVVLSDMAPRTSGAKARDQALSEELFLLALGIARRCGRQGSSFVGKLFTGRGFPALRQAVAAAYRSSRIARPSGVRANSTEVYLVGLGLRFSPDPAGDTAGAGDEEAGA